MKTTILYPLTLFPALLGLALPAVADVTVASPDGHVRFVLSSSAQGHLAYTVTFNGKNIIDPSLVGIVVDKVDLAAGAVIGAAETYKVNETYPWWGAHSTATNSCNGAKVAMTHPKSSTSYTLEIRAYNDGVAFRHLVPGTGARVPDEVTEFHVPASSVIAPQNVVSGYEGVYPWRTTKNTIESMVAHSAPVIFSYSSRHPADIPRVTTPAVVNGPISTPWRIVMIGADLNALFNSDIIHNVNPPPDPKLFPKGINEDWIKPGRCIFMYLDGGDRTVEGNKEFARLAQQLGFEYNILEGFWKNWPESQLKEVVDYSRQRGVKILLWTYSADFEDQKYFDDLVAMCNRTGVAGLKIDFWDDEHKWIIDRYERVMKTLAEHKLLVDFHGANKPTGLERTYPNIVGYEAIRGLEFPGPYAQHDATLPFTRMLAGMADFNPTHFGSRMADLTWAHMVAQAAILQAPEMAYAANPANMLANPSVDVLKALPTVWDETVVLPFSDIREVAGFARRSGDTWFIAIMNGPYARNVKIDLSSFLGKSQPQGGSAITYNATLLRDMDKPAALKVEHVKLTASDTLSVDMNSGGGFVAMLKK
ncbi:MAG: glycoside hydrolase family 97 catalytic domain-containing protein [Verrucomicrobiota bacterium]